MKKFVVTTFYKFVDLPDVQEVKLAMYKFCKENGILGTALLAEEGVNSTLTGSRESIDAFYQFMKTLPVFNDLEYKESFCDTAPFEKLKIKIKPEIIKFDTSVDGKLAGERLSPKDWEKLIDDGVPMIDTRNDYEVIFGTFKNAIDPQIRNFTELADWLDINLRDHDREKPVAMFCTGGVRCEKSTSYLRKKGFKKVFHLDGGIIKYFMESDRKRDYWNGQCFVFDDRIAIDHDLKPYTENR
ncbi:MAG: hypothetical protein LW825_03825 [Candidatus Jidaibacter sp.]|jgi:UPF0176 protein|nr:hypothetical protein [Candidatus Jidaibacter sp.]